MIDVCDNDSGLEAECNELDKELPCRKAFLLELLELRSSLVFRISVSEMTVELCPKDIDCEIISSVDHLFHQGFCI